MKSSNTKRKERTKTMVTFRGTTFQDLGTTRGRISQLDSYLKNLSLPTLRSMQQDIQKDISNSQEIARYRAVLLRHLKNGKEIEENFFLMHCPFENLILGEVEGIITNGVELAWRGTWKRTYFDRLKPEQQTALIEQLTQKLKDTNAENRYLRRLLNYLQCYINGRNIQFKTFEELSQSVSKAITGFASTFTLLLENPFVEA